MLELCHLLHDIIYGRVRISTNTPSRRFIFDHSRELVEALLVGSCQAAKAHVPHYIPLFGDRQSKMESSASSYFG